MCELAGLNRPIAQGSKPTSPLWGQEALVFRGVELKTLIAEIRLIKARRGVVSSSGPQEEGEQAKYLFSLKKRRGLKNID